MYASYRYTYATGVTVLVSVCVLHYILATRVCKFLHACIASYTRGLFKLWIICTIYEYVAVSIQSECTEIMHIYIIYVFLLCSNCCELLSDNIHC